MYSDDDSEPGNPADLPHYSTRTLLALRYTGEYDLDEILAVLNTREHIKSKAEQLDAAHKKHQNGPEHEKKKMRFHKNVCHGMSRRKREMFMRADDLIWAEYKKGNLA